MAPQIEERATGSEGHWVAVSHPRELRGVWIASVANINFPSRTGLDAEAQKAELDGIVDTAAESHLNAIFFQVRPELDALYESEIEPWSRYLTGIAGGDPGYDPLGYLLERAHARAIEVHAWLNPYRAKQRQSSVAAREHMTLTHPDLAHNYAGGVWMDPGAPVVQDRLVEVVVDIVRRYEVDGIHFDDYFYPYPDGSEPFPDSRTYTSYQSAGGELGRHDWRRHNVNVLVERVASTLKEIAPQVRFGISPFGIYRPGIPAGIVGFDQYDGIFADPLLWKSRGWVDYIAPQLYWPSTQTPQAYGTLIDWWSQQPDAQRYTFAGIQLSKVGSAPAWSTIEIQAQIELSRLQRDRRSLGNIFFHIGPLQQNTLGIRDLFRDHLFIEPALSPPVLTDMDRVIAPPELEIKDNEVALTTPDDAFATTLYRFDNGDWCLLQVLSITERRLSPGPGTWAIATVGRNMVESLGTVFELP